MSKFIHLDNEVGSHLVRIDDISVVSSKTLEKTFTVLMNCGTRFDFPASQYDALQHALQVTRPHEVVSGATPAILSVGGIHPKRH